MKPSDYIMTDLQFVGACLVYLVLMAIPFIAIYAAISVIFL